MTRLAAALFALGLGLSPGFAVSASEAPALTATDVNAFFDGFLPVSISRADIAGVTVAVVKDGKVLTLRNYGYADVAARRPVTNATLFRPGSISKLFTWTAVMQQVERGKLDLDSDVNGYLDFKIPAAFGRPITLRNLMTHTAGFEETFKDEFDQSAAQLEPLGTYLRTHMPRRIYAPGAVVAYSNYGATLAGYIVQRVSSQRYDDYIERDIFRPLGMNHSTMRQPLPPALAPFLSKGYVVGSGPAYPFEYIQVSAAGSLSSTSTDMSNFMIAQLQDGRFGSARILKPQTARLMHTLSHTEDPGLNGFDLGFYQENSNGLQIIGHAGDTNAFHSDLHLVLDKNLGFFVSFNSVGKDGAVEGIRTELFRAFLDRYFPFRTVTERAVPSAASDAKMVQGWYLSSRREQNAFPLVFLMGEGHVTAQPDGTIAFSPLQTPAAKPKLWREVGPLTYREIGGPARLIFVRKGDRIDYLTTDDSQPVQIFQPVSFWQQMNVIEWLGGFALLTFLITLIVWPIGALVRRYYQKPLALTGRAARLRLVTRLTCAAGILDLAGWVAFVSAVDKAHIPDVILYLLYILGIVCAIGAIGMIANAVVTWTSTRRSLLAKIAETLPALAGIGFSWLVLAFGLANFNVHY
ncbi:MAG: beta-lactamase family protein [Candidatus Eremiobacteraeota bacterium]|nr:beta-lactamase family protein [Candidatus Eremiobacteraeota bacterium]MBC5803405.1 beta-lactamase family protein [Candidatus Eremiobacteraeota bacterium]MBC5822503.1 beta-lactamase family protein [Candidatus Eremiobacteraeota bacterium]